MLSYNLTNRRKTDRGYIRIPIECSIPDAENKAVKNLIAIAIDISPEGLYFDIDQILALNTEINITFQLPHEESIIHARIKVVRVEARETERKFGIGAAFVNIEEKSIATIKRFLERLNIDNLLELAIKKGASDLHLLADQSPVLRVHGELEITDKAKLYPDELRQMLYSIMTREQIRTYEKEKELDFGIQYDMQNRFRINVHQQRGFIEATFRLINTKAFSFEELKIPDVVKDLARQKDGLILIAGPTGSGKTTTIAAMVDLINHERKAVIITLERPIEYVHPNIKSIIKQREIGVDTNSFSVALRSTLRQDPNVIVVGELDDTETIKTALLAAEAGYLVIASFHAPDSIQAIDRLMSVFPPENRKQILFQLSNCLRGIVSQLLLPRKDKPGRILATETLIATDAVKINIRNDQLIQLPTIMQTGSAFKMQLMYDAVKKYWQEGIIDEQVFNFYCEGLTRHGR